MHSNRYARKHAGLAKRLHRLQLWDDWWLDFTDPRIRGKLRKTVPYRLYGKKAQWRRRAEERCFRQAVRNALVHDEPLPVYKPDWAD